MAAWFLKGMNKNTLKRLNRAAVVTEKYKPDLYICWKGHCSPAPTGKHASQRFGLAAASSEPQQGRFG